MAKQGVIDKLWVESKFSQIKSNMFHVMQENAELKKSVLELKSKLDSAEVHFNKLIQYNNFAKTLIRRGSQVDQLVSPMLDLPHAIEEMENLIINTKKDIIYLESKRQNETKPDRSDKKIVSNMNKILSELLVSNYELQLKKESTIIKLKTKIEELDPSYNRSKEKLILDSNVEEYERLKAKNLRLKEMITMNINQHI